MPKFNVISPVEHNGKRYDVGATLTVSVEIAEALLAAGAVASPIEVQPAPQGADAGIPGGDDAVAGTASA